MFKPWGIKVTMEKKTRTFSILYKNEMWLLQLGEYIWYLWNCKDERKATSLQIVFLELCDAQSAYLYIATMVIGNLPFKNPQFLRIVPKLLAGRKRYILLWVKHTEKLNFEGVE